MPTWIPTLAAIGYVALLFLIAFWAENRAQKGKSIVSNSYVYALSLAIYCTAWTFYGSVGRAATSGLGFLPIYIGPTITAPIWILVLRKIIIISKAQRITSIADFISSRYGKSTWLGIIATIIAVVGIVPYISIQLKAISTSFEILTQADQLQHTVKEIPFYLDVSLYISIALAIFAIYFGTSKLDPNERHEGLVAAVAFESLFKLLAFLAVGFFVTYYLFDGFGDIFQQAFEKKDLRKLFLFEEVNIDSWEWFWLIILSMSAILFLPRQFHVGVVENIDSNYTANASWAFPLYLLLINIFVIPIAIGGLIYFNNQPIEPDTFVLNLPLHAGYNFLALLVAIGGFSAATSMVIVAVIALSIMISNNLVTPFLIRPNLIRSGSLESLAKPLLSIRRVSIIIVLLLAYGYFRAVGEGYSLVSIGLISFTAIAQFIPVIIGGLYWKRGTKAGAFAGLISGFIIWGYTLPLPTLAETGIISNGFIQNGLFGIELLKPYEFLGLEGSGRVANAAFWSLFFNGIAYVIGSLMSTPSALEITQADIFVDIYKYRSSPLDSDIFRRRARIQDIRILLTRFLGARRSAQIMSDYEQQFNFKFGKEINASPELINYAETHLSGAIGSASAKVIIASIAKEDPISLEEMFTLLEETQEIMQYSKALERKSEELEKTTTQLKVANERLKELDRLKATFITTVTHELRTPITSIKAMSKILQDHQDLSTNEKNEFLGIIVTESERLTRLINQVLDVEKIQADHVQSNFEKIDFGEVTRQAFLGLKQLMVEKNIHHTLHKPDEALLLLGHYDRLTQVVINLISNAIKFCDPRQGRIDVSVYQNGDKIYLEVQDNGKGIAKDDQSHIFEKFTQVSDQQAGKPQGSGLGLFITKTIIQNHDGEIKVESKPGFGANFIVVFPKI